MEVKTLYENLVFEGAAMRGFAYTGALVSLQNMNILNNIKRFAGTSIGAFFACCMAIGMSPEQLHDKLDKELKSELLFPNYCFLRLIYNVWKYYGMYSSNSLKQFLIKLISPYVSPDITFVQLYEEKGKELVLVSCDLNIRKPVYLHRHSVPNMK